MSQKTKRENKIDPPPFSNHPIPHHQKIIPSKIKKIPPSYLENQPNFSLPCHPRNKPLG